MADENDDGGVALPDANAERQAGTGSLSWNGSQTVSNKAASETRLEHRADQSARSALGSWTSSHANGHANTGRGTVVEEPPRATTPPAPVQAADTSRPTFTRINLYLATNGANLNWLVRQFKLASFGNYNLTRAARIAMESLALMLVVIGVYELVTWVVLFNVILQAGLFRLSWMTPLAVLLALPFVVMTLIWEQWLMTADLSETASAGRKWGPRFAIGMRVLIIGLVALVNSQPVELLIFHYKIEHRLQQERAREEAVEQFKAHDDKSKRQQQKSGTAVAIDMETIHPVESLQYKTTNEDKLKADQNANIAKAHYDAAISTQTTKAVEYRIAYKAYTVAKDAYGEKADETVSKKTAADFSGQALQRAQEQVRTAKGALDDATSDRKTKQDEYRQAANEYKKSAEPLGLIANFHEKQAEAFPERFNEFINKVEHAPTDTAVYEWGTSGETNREYLNNDPKSATSEKGLQAEARRYDWSDRRRALVDLTKGRPPRWPDVSRDLKLKLSELLGFQDFVHDPDEQARDVNDAFEFNLLYWIIFGIALVIPLFTLAMKLLMRGELKSYYSASYQADRGHPDAVAYREANRGD